MHLRRSIISTLAVTAALLRQEAAAQTVNLGSAEPFAVAAGSGITNTGATTITGDVGSFPTTSQTGFGSVTLNGVNHGGNSITQGAKIAMVNAYNDAAGRAANVVYSPAFDLGGLTLTSGVYNNPTSFGLTGMLTLDAGGKPNSIWIFQTGSTLVTASNSSIVLINGADGCRIFWKVGSSATLGTNSVFVGTSLASTSITANTGATVNGRLLALNGAVTMDTNTIAAAICKELDSGTGTDAGTGTGGTSKLKIEEMKAALILAGKLVDVNSLPGLTSIYTQGFAQFDTEVFSVQQRFADLRQGARGFAAPAAYNDLPIGKSPIGKSPIGGKSPLGGKDPMAVDNGIANEVQRADDDRLGFFITGTGDSITAGEGDQYEGTAIGINLGIDMRLSEHFVGGLTFGYSHSKGELVDDGKVEADGGKAALYGMYHRGGFYTEGLIGGGANHYDIERSAFLGTAHGSTNGQQFDSYLGVGYDIHHEGWTLTPMASLLYTVVGIDGYDEVGSLVPLTIESQSASSLRSRIGPRLAHSSQWGDTRITPSVSVQWQHEFLDDELPFDARFANDPSRLFTVHGPKVERDSVLVTAALHIAWKRYAGYLAYQADFGRDNYQSQSALIGLRASW